MIGSISWSDATYDIEKDTTEVRGSVEEGVQRVVQDPDNYLAVYFQADMKTNAAAWGNDAKYTLVSRRASRVNYRPMHYDPNGFMHWISMKYEVTCFGDTYVHFGYSADTSAT